MTIADATMNFGPRGLDIVHLSRDIARHGTSAYLPGMTGTAKRYSMSFLLCLVVVALPAWAGDPEGEWLNQTDQTVVKISSSGAGLLVESQIRVGGAVLTTKEIYRRQGQTWVAPPAPPGLEQFEILLRSRDNWQTAELLVGEKLGQAEEFILGRNPLIRLSPGEGRKHVEQLESKAADDRAIQEPKAALREIAHALFLWADKNPPDASVALIKRFFSVGCTPAPPPDDSWVAGCAFAYQASVKAKARSFVIRAKGTTPKTAHLSCTLDTEKPGASPECGSLR